MPAALPPGGKGTGRCACLTLALDIARQELVRQSPVAPNRMLILAAVRDLLQTEPALSGAPRLLLHADDMPLVQQYLAEDLQAAGWLLRSDPAISRGGCRVQSASGEVDASHGNPLATRERRRLAAARPMRTESTSHD